MQASEDFNWNDLRYFLELSRVKKLVAAAPRLGVEATTVKRRIAILETQIGSRLFLQAKNGYELTDAGRALLKCAEQIEFIANGVHEGLTGADYKTTGSVRLGATEGFGTCFLSKTLWRLHKDFPGLHVDLIAVPRFVNLSEREADIAVAIERPQEGRYVITKLIDYVLGLYASKSYLEHISPILDPSDLRSHPFVGYIDDLVYSKELRYLDEIISRNHTFAMRSSSLVAQMEAVKDGAGIAILPRFMAANDLDLVPLMSSKVQFLRSFWLITREDNFHLSRIKIVWNFVRQSVEMNKSVFGPPK